MVKPMIRVDGKDLPWTEGMTVADLLQTVENIEFCSVVRLNKKLVSSPQFDKTLIPDGAKIDILPLVAGG